MTKDFNNLKELKPYYDVETNTYVFRENGKRIDVKFNFDLIVNANIMARNITAGDIYARDIMARDIIAMDIDACDIIARNITAGNITAKYIDFFEMCVSYQNIECNSIKWRKENHIMKALHGEIIIKGESKC